jgi:LacI family transcriptional regulator
MQQGARRITISQVAAAAGVDRSTVSRAFTRPDLIRAETTRHVLAVAERLGYAPNRTARALSTGRTANLALVVHDLTNPFIPALILGVQAEADLSDYCVFIGNSDETPAQEARLVRRFAAQVDGTILVSSRATDAAVAEMAAAGPLVLVNREIEGISRVLIDSSEGIRQAVAHLAGLGHRRIAYVGGPELSWSNAERRRAAAAAALDRGVDLVQIAAGRASFEAGRAVVGRLRDSATTAAIAFDDVLAQGLLSGLAVAGITVPRDYSLIGCDDVLGAVTHPPLTSISNRAGDAGRAAVRILMRALAEGALPVTRQVLDTELVLRATTAPGMPGN